MSEISNQMGLKRQSKKKLTIISLAGLLVVGGAGYSVYKYMGSKQNAAVNVQYITVKKGDVSETVSASGTVQAAQQVSLNFPNGGEKLIAVNVKVGDHVKKGQVLAQLDDSTVKAQLSNAEANLQSAQAHLSQLEQTSPQDLAVAQTNVTKAKLSLDNPQMTYSVQKDEQAVQKAKTSLDNAQRTYDQDNSLYQSGALSKNDLDQAKTTLNQAQADYNSSLSQYNQTKAQTQNGILQAKAEYDAAVAQLNQTQASSPGNIEQAKASVEQAKAQLQQQQISLQKLTLTAPFDGVITQVNGHVGEAPGTITGTSSGSTNTMIMMDNSDADNLQVMAQVSQTDIGKVKQGMKTTLTTTAFDGKNFQGQVDVVYPEATTASGVTTYNVLITVDNHEGLLKPGMTMNVIIEEGVHKNVLYIPAAALKDQNGKDGVLVTSGSSSSGNANSQANNNNRNNSGANGGNGGNGNKSNRNSSLPYHFQSITVGYFSPERVEVTSGLNEGDQVVLQMNNSGASSNSRTSNKGGLPGMGGSFGGVRGMR